MFLAVLLASIYFICYSCGLVEGDGPRNSSERNGGASNDSWNIPQAGAVAKGD
jgi:hypothetical protein